MRTLRLLIFAALAAACVFAAGAEAEAVCVYTPEDLFSIENDPRGSYTLMADIDMTGRDWRPLEFFGILEGNGRTIYNLCVRSAGDARDTTVDGNHLEYDTALAGLFSRAEGAQIRNLNLVNADVRLDTQDNAFLALLAGAAKAAVIENVYVSGRAYLYTAGRMGGVAGLVGFGTGTIKNCVCDVTLVYVDTNTKVKCEQFMGGALACGYMDIEGTNVLIDGYASVHGYVHNGGVVGMHHNHDANRYKGYVRDCAAKGRISFFEHNSDRRAYCKAIIGEKLNNNVTVSGNRDLGFERHEVKTYAVNLLPEMCAQAEYAREVVSPSCAGCGYSLYTCKTCGYSYKDEYTAPAHMYTGQTVAATCAQEGYTLYACGLCGNTYKADFTPPAHDYAEETLAATCAREGEIKSVCRACGDTRAQTLPMIAHTPGEWMVTRAADYATPGERAQLCAACGCVLAREALPVLKYAERVELNAQTLEIGRGERARLCARVLPEDAANARVTWTSSDENVCAVDENGVLTAFCAGEAEIICASADGAARAACHVRVNMNLNPFEQFAWDLFRLLSE